MQHGAQIWQRALTKLQSIMTPVNYNQWLQHTRCVGYESDTLTVGVPSTFNKEYLEKRIQHLIGRTMESIGYGHVQLCYTVVPEDTISSNNRSRVAARAAPSGGNGTALALASTTTAESAIFNPSSPGGRDMPPALNPNYVFESFIVGGSNRFAYAASVAVAELPAERYNPLFIYGNVGLGKTHLLHAIGHQALRMRPHLRILYTSSEKFVNEMIGSIQKGHTEEFRSKYRTVDILLIDDIQFIAGKESTQEEFFHTFNALYEAQGQIVMTSDRHPKAMTTLVERLRSRFEWGLIADVQAPDLETRIAILQDKAENQSVPVPKTVIDYIARRVPSNIRELEGTLTSITAKASLQGSPVTMELAVSVLGTMSGGARRTKPTVEEVLKAVLEHYKVDREAMLSPARDRAIALPRQVAMYLIREETDSSLPKIGTFLGNRDHSTIMHGIEKIADELKNENAQLRKDITAIRSALFEVHDR